MELATTDPFGNTYVLSYWRGSLKDPMHIIFMRYEEMKADPRGEIKKLAEFLGCPFTEEEEERGSVKRSWNFLLFVERFGD